LAVEDPQLLSIYSYARNNPTSHIDPDGRMPHILAGALIGGLIGAGAYLVKSANSGNFSWKGLGGATAGGAVSGALAAATGGASLFVQGAVAGVGGGLVSRAIETGSVSQTFAPKAIIADAIIGGTSAAVVGRVGAVVAPKVVAGVKTVISRAKDVAISRAAARAAASGGAVRFTQTTASPMFSAGGKFAGRSISQVAYELRSGALRPAEVPVEIIVRNGNRLIVNTRSSLALRQAGIPDAQWNLINRTGVPEVEANITERLARNKLGDEGSEVLRITGSGANASTYRKP
jgi:hypothetical protein